MSLSSEAEIPIDVTVTSQDEDPEEVAKEALAVSETQRMLLQQQREDRRADSAAGDSTAASAVGSLAPQEDAVVVDMAGSDSSRDAGRSPRTEATEAGDMKPLERGAASCSSSSRRSAATSPAAADRSARSDPLDFAAASTAAAAAARAGSAGVGSYRATLSDSGDGTVLSPPTSVGASPVSRGPARPRTDGPPTSTVSLSPVTPTTPAAARTAAQPSGAAAAAAENEARGGGRRHIGPPTLRTAHQRLAARPPGAPELPPALRVLFLAARANASAQPSRVQSPVPPAGAAEWTASGGVRTPPPLMRHDTPLMYLLQLLSEAYIAARRRAAAQTARAAQQVRCATLYTGGMEWRAAQEAQRQRALDAQAAEVQAACSFQPRVSAHARALPAKGQAQFMEKCVDWDKETTARLHAKYQREEAVTAAPTAPRIDPASRRIAERLRKDGDARCARPLWAPKDRSDIAAVAPPSPSSALASGRGPIGPSAGPTTSAEEQRQHDLLRRILADDDAADSAASSLHQTGDAQRRSPAPAPGTSGLQENSGVAEPRRRADVAAFLARVNEDARRRSEELARRLEERENGDGGALYASGTGQPLFEPNALPTVVRDGRRVRYDELSPQERKELRKVLHGNDAERVLLRYQRQQRDARARSGNSATAEKTARPSLGDDVVAALAMSADHKERTLERLRAQLAAEETFHPHLTPRSIRLAGRRTGGVKIYERLTPPPPASSSARKDGTARGSGESPHQLHAPTSPRATERMLQRQALWSERREAQLTRVARREEERRYAECSFTPHRALAHQLDAAMDDLSGRRGGDDGDASSVAATGESETRRLEQELRRHRRRSSVYSGHELNQLVASANVRLANELELLRSQTAHLDPVFVSSVLAANKKSLMESTAEESAHSVGPGGMRARGSTVGLKETPQYTLRNLTFRNAPRIGGASGDRMPAHETLSPIPKAQQFVPSASRTPHGRDGAMPVDLHSDTSEEHVRAEQRRHSNPSRLNFSQGPGATTLADDYNDDGGEDEDEEEDEEESLPYLDDPWAALDAQVDFLLRRYA